MNRNSFAEATRKRISKVGYQPLKEGDAGRETVKAAVKRLEANIGIIVDELDDVDKESVRQLLLWYVQRFQGTNNS